MTISSDWPKKLQGCCAHNNKTVKTIKDIERDAGRLFRLCRRNGSVDDERVRQVLKNLLASKRRGYLSIAARFQRLVKLEWARHSARIESPVSLPGDLHDSLNATLLRMYGATLAIRFVETPDLIGGLRITVGSDVYDGSIRGALAKLENAFEN